MRRVTTEFLQQAIAQCNEPIHLVAVEVSPAYLSNITPYGDSKSLFQIDTELREKLISGEVTNDTDLDNGIAWIASFENGDNLGTMRLVDELMDEGIGIDYVQLEQEVEYDFNENNTDRVRISKYLFLAMRNQDVGFYIPDPSSDGLDVEVTYKAFPMGLTPVGSSIDGEILNMSVDVSNVNLLVGNLVQDAGGLRGNRVIHLTTFEPFVHTLTHSGEGRESAIQENMYIDSVTITNQAVNFTLESRFNIMAIQIPTSTYNRNFCRWKYRTPECGWQSLVSGETNLDSSNYPMAKVDSCDHSLVGPNGCAAHRNTVRFGAFPSLSSK